MSSRSMGPSFADRDKIGGPAGVHCVEGSFDSLQVTQSMNLEILHTHEARHILGVFAT